MVVIGRANPPRLMVCLIKRTRPGFRGFKDWQDCFNSVNLVNPQILQIMVIYGDNGLLFH